VQRFPGPVLTLRALSVLRKEVGNECSADESLRLDCLALSQALFPAKSFKPANRRMDIQGHSP